MFSLQVFKKLSPFYPYASLHFNLHAKNLKLRKGDLKEIAFFLMAFSKTKGPESFKP